jgi:hypothetical protein
MRPVSGSQIERNGEGGIVSVPAHMTYVTANTVAPFTRRDTAGSDGTMEDLTWDETEVRVHNGRLHRLTLDRNGFELVQSPELVLDDIDFYNQHDVVENYYPLCNQLLRQSLGEGVQVYAFDHNVRSNGARRDLENANGAVVQNPLGVVHADYTRVSAPKRLEQLAQEPKTNDVHRQFLKEGETLLDPKVVDQILHGKRRFAMANVWRNINRGSPVLQRPLACIDAKTAHLESLRTFSIYYADRIGENYFGVHDQKQKWFYFPEMTHHEAILLKQWDSYGDLAMGDSLGDLSTFSAHSAFIDPTSPEDSPPRESIEVRCVIIYPEENDAEQNY